MLCIIFSKEDEASINISKFILRSRKWREEKGLLISEDFLLYFIDDLHIYHDNIDKEIEEKGYRVDTIIFASRHSSSQNKKTLSVHAIGNFGNAEYGGKNGEIIKCNPFLMLNAIKTLKEKNLESYEVCYEATHHGPYLEKPSFFIEIGSTRKEWNDEKACQAVAEAILEFSEAKEEAFSAIGIGGGHYAPRFSEIAIEKNVAFGHIAPKYVKINDEILFKMKDATPHCRKVYLHGRIEGIEEKIKKMGLEIG
ncbi:MAG: transposase [Thermoplasmatales archaeon]|nr:transposase [Thermoplasmatales archaeon]